MTREELELAIRVATEIVKQDRVLIIGSQSILGSYLCAAKLAHNEEKDREFVTALIDAGLINPRLLRNRIDAIPDDRLTPARKRVIRMFAKAADQRPRA